MEQQRGLERKELIIESALQLIIERGVHATTHRNIAEAAAVPLGSLTYYFDGLSELFVQAFELLCTRLGTALRADLEGAATTDEAIEVLTDAICGSRHPGNDMLNGLLELYSYGSHNEKVMDICRRWLRTSHDSLRIHFPEHTTRALDALHEGWHLHQRFTGERAPRDLVHSAIRALVEQQQPARNTHAP